MRAQGVLAHAYAPVTMIINPNPPAAGREWEFAIMNHPEALICRLLKSAGVDVLASKTELRPSMRATVGPEPF